MVLPFLKKPVTVLKALLVGQRVALDGRPCVLEDGQLWTVAVRQDPNGRNEEEVLLTLEMTLDGFLAAAGRLSDEEVFILAAQTALLELTIARRERAGKEA